jgi:hypothetical protein
MAGIAAARSLCEQKCAVTVFEKSRGLGGRCATKRWEDHVVDHGAQYFTLRDPDFSSEVRAAVGGSLCRIGAPVLSEDGSPLPDDGRYYHADGNSRLARGLAGGLDVRCGVAVAPIVDQVIDGQRYHAIVSTAPLPQTLALAGVSDGPNVDYVPCLTAVFLYTHPLAEALPGAYARSDRSGSPLAWSACENHKTGRIRPGSLGMVAQASEVFSREFLEEDPGEWSQRLRALVEERWEIPSDRLAGHFAHRWRYARVAAPLSTPPDLPEGWFFAGDALAGSRVESAWLAGRDVAARVGSFLENADSWA